MAYEGTEVAVSRSQEQIRNVLIKRAVQSVNFGERFDTAGDTMVGVEFVYQDTMVRMFATIEAPNEKDVTEKLQRARNKKPRDEYRREMIEAEARRVWRVLHWSLKVRMEAIEEGLEVFEQAFLPHIVDPSTGRTLWDIVHPAVEKGALRIDGSGLKALGAGR